MTPVSGKFLPESDEPVNCHHPLAKRKAWIYEVPLNAVHHLRETLNSVPDGQDVPEDVLEKYDAPVLAAALKLWLLELEPPLGLYDAWDEFRKIYPSSKRGCRMETLGPR